MKFLRLLMIVWVGIRYGLDDFLLGHSKTRWLRPLVRGLFFWRDLSRPRGVRLRLALESLGPLFVKFGQMLSTLRDLLPDDIADELALLQDRVPPYPFAQVERELNAAYGKPWRAVFAELDPTPVASASVAQVHFAFLHDGRPVAVKVLRPGIARIIVSYRSQHQECSK